MVRTARPDDVPSLVSLVRELATYERAADQVRIDAVALNAALFTTSPKAHCLVVDADGEVAGMALRFVTFSTWFGRTRRCVHRARLRPP